VADQPRKLPEIIDAVGCVELLALWLAAINGRDRKTMIEAQRRLKSQFGISVGFFGKPAGQGGGR
jgi:hypothetical protein